MSVLIQALRDPGCYLHPVAEVRVIETHISWLLLTGTYAYKVKKPVKLEFVDFLELDTRLHYCREELRLNRRFAPALYLDVVPITGTAARPTVGGSGPAIEYAVRMREFPQSDLLDSLLAQGRLTPADIDALADTCARFHACAAVAPCAYGTPASLLAPAAANFDSMRASLKPTSEPAALQALEHWTRTEYARRQASFSTRKRDGRIRECHGDLHLGNIAMIDGVPTLFDCIEFNDAFRWIDVMNEMAFAVMDLHARGRPDLGQRLLCRYLEASGDYTGLAVLPFYLVYRAMVRAKVDAIRAGQPDLERDARERQWRDFAERVALAGTFAKPRARFLAITCGLSGSGKTHASQHALQKTFAIRLRSDVERKRLSGLSPCEASGSDTGGGIYTEAASDETFEHLAELARTVLDAGYAVIVDASFLRRARRTAFKDLAGVLGVPFVIISCSASEATLAERIARRQKEGRDASEATLDVLAQQKLLAEPLDASERAAALVVDGADPSSLEAVLHRLAAMSNA